MTGTHVGCVVGINQSWGRNTRTVLARVSEGVQIAGEPACKNSCSDSVREQEDPLHMVLARRRAIKARHPSAGSTSRTTPVLRAGAVPTLQRRRSE